MQNFVQKGEIITFAESVLTHPTHSDGLVDHDDPVLIGRFAGVSHQSAAATTDLIDVALDGVFNLSVHPIHNGLSVGETVYADPSTVALSDDQTGVPFGTAVDAAPGNVTATIRVRLFGATPGATGAGS